MQNERKSAHRTYSRVGCGKRSVHGMTCVMKQVLTRDICQSIKMEEMDT